MVLSGVGCVIPSRKIYNEEILELVRYHSSKVYNKPISILLDTIRKNLNRSGVQTRFWSGNGEKPLNMVAEAVGKALKHANLSYSEIDLLIYVGIDRGFLEPANANFVAKKLGIPHVRALDIVDACMGWCSASQIIQSLMAKEDIASALVVSAEFPLQQNGTIFPNCFTISNDEELLWKFPTLTVGEAASATIFTKKDSTDWIYHFQSNAEYANLCTIPLPYFERFMENGENKKHNTPLQFSVLGKEMLLRGYKKGIEVLDQALKLHPNPKFIIPHTYSNTIAYKASSKLNVDNKLVSIFKDLGNVATASIPCGLYRAIKQNKITSGDRGIGWVVSGGLKYSAFDIFYFNE